MKRHAFTLIELLVVIAIIGLLSMIAVVSLNTSRDKSKISAGQSFDQSLRNGLGDQLAGEWLMNECSGNTVSDASNSGNTATFGGTAAWSANTVSGSGCAASLNGSNYLGTSLNLQSPDVTFSAWVYPTSVSAYNSIVAKELQYKYMIYNGSLFAGTGCNGTSWNGALLTGAPVPVNAWSMVALSVDSVNRTVKLFLNGHQVAQGAGCAPTSYNNNALAIGSDVPFGASNSFHGNIDDVRVYATALSLTQIQKLYAEGLLRPHLAER